MKLLTSLLFFALSVSAQVVPDPSSTVRSTTAAVRISAAPGPAGTQRWRQGVLASVKTDAPAAPVVDFGGTLIVGSPADSIAMNDGDSFPFGGEFNGEYQQVYTSSLFSGPITITGLEFFNTQSRSLATALNSGTYTISLSTTSADWNTLSSTPASNIGSDHTVVFSGSITQAWAFGNTLSITLSTPFTYTPGPGANLLMDVQVSGSIVAFSPDNWIFFDTNGNAGGNLNGNTFFGTYMNGTAVTGGPNIHLQHGFGLVTGFRN